jgi:predicted RNase H-like nuclease (RuvC/YqgF family)
MEGILFCTVIFAQIMEHGAENAEGVSWSHGVWGVVGMAVGAAIAGYFRYRGHIHATDSKSEKDKLDIVFQQGQTLRNELMSEILENRRQLTELQKEHLGCQRENIELKAAQNVSNSAIRALQDENTTLKVQVAELQKQVKQLKGEEE